MSRFIQRAQREPGMAAAYALGAATLLWVGGKALRKGVNRLFPSGVPGETNTALLATPVSAASAKEDELGNVEEYDYVIVGGGTAGCVIASRLSEDRRVKVLLIEAGHSDLKQIFSRIPAGFARLFNTSADWDLQTEPQKHCNNRSYYWPRGKMLGGCSAINAMIAQRGGPDDYDEWEKLGNEGWGYASVSKYFKKLEGFYNKSRYHQIKDTSEHGTSGPWKFSYSFNTRLGKLFVKACDSVGIPAVENVNTSKGVLGATACQTSITPDGERCSTAVAYITADVARRPNLRISVGQTVTKIFFDKSGAKPRAVGVEMASGKRSPIRYRVRAKKEVIVSAGALHSPHILMLSGVGPSAELKKHDIPIVADIDGIGKNLQDHLAVMLIAKVKHESLQYLAHPVKSLPALVEWLRHGTGPMTTNVAEAFAFVRAQDHGAPKEVTDQTSGPKGADLELLMGAICYQDHGRVVPPHGQDFLAIGPLGVRPESRGTVTLRDNSPFTPPVLDANYLGTESDRALMRTGCKLVRDVMHSKTLSGDFVEWYEPKNFDKFDDAKIDETVIRNSETIYHPAGTCAMGDPSQGGVVDARLRVHGIEGLRVADASIMPKIVAAHPQMAVVMIGEKVSDMIKEDAAGR